MNSPVSSNNELLQAFAKNSLQKIQELKGATNVLIKEGAKPELLEAIYRTTLAIKSFASTCNLSNIINFITTVLDVQFEKIRQEETKEFSEELKQQIKNNIAILRNMISEIQTGDLNKNIPENNLTTQEAAYVTGDKRVALLEAIGQLSVWSFHDILNSLAKIEGFSDLINGVVDRLDDSQANLKNEIKVNINKTLENTAFMTNLINQIRSLRGKTIFEQKEYKIKDLIKDLQDSMSQPKKDIQWSLSSLPDVTINCDRTIFAQLWAHLWKLLQEWQIPGALLNPALTARLTQATNSPTDPKFNNILSLYIWTENADSSKFLPENLFYSKQTPYPDLAHIFYFSTKIAEKIEIEVSCTKTPSGNALFRISIPCSEPGQQVSASSSSSSVELQKSASNKGNSSTKSVLVVDDEKDLRTILSMKINRMGYAVHTASNLQEAIQILNEKDITLVISDLFLQGESGLDLLKSLSEARPNVPFIFISGADEDDVPASIFDILSKYAKAFLTKPVTNNVLKETIEKIIGPGSV